MFIFIQQHVKMLKVKAKQQLGFWRVFSILLDNIK